MNIDLESIYAEADFCALRDVPLPGESPQHTPRRRVVNALLYLAGQPERPAWGQVRPFLEGLAAAAGCGYAMARVLWERYKRNGWRGLCDGRSMPRAEMVEGGARSLRFRAYVQKVAEANQLSTQRAIEHIQDSFRYAQPGTIPGFERWQPCGREGALPPGVSATSLRAIIRKHELANIRQGLKTNHATLPMVLTTRAGVRPGTVYEFDDMWHDHLVLVPGQKTPVRVLEFGCLDVASGCRIHWGFCPRVIRDDGTKQGLTSRMFVLFLAYVLRYIGYDAEQGVTLVVEHASRLQERAKNDGTTQWYVILERQTENTYITPGMHKNVRAGANMIWEATDPNSSASAYVNGEGKTGHLASVLYILDTYEAYKKNPDSLALQQLFNPGLYQTIANMSDNDVQRMYAAVAGSSVATLGSASMQDLQRQLESMRNRSTLLGEAKVNADPGAKGLHAWVNAESGYHKVDADSWAPGYTLNGWGGTLGGSMEVSSNTTVGLALTAMYNDLKTDGADSGRGDLDATYLSGFVRTQDGAWSHTFLATAGLSDITLDRTVSYGTGVYKTHGETDGYAAGLMYEVAYTNMLNEQGTLAIQPVFNVQYRHSKINGYNETGSDAGLRVNEVTADVVTFGLGARMQAAISENAFGRSSVFEARVLAKADAGDNTGKATNALLRGSVSQEVESASVGKFGIEIGAGLTLPVSSDGGTFFIDGSAEFRSGYTNFNASAGYRISF